MARSRSFPVPFLVLTLVGAAVPAAARIDPEAWLVRRSRMVLREATVQAANTDVKIEVYTEPEHQAWGRRLAEWTVALVPVLYRNLGLPEDGKVVRVIEEPDLRAAGWHDRKYGVRLRYPAGLAELAHQLVHTWIHPGTVAPRWLAEGLATWEGLAAMRAAGLGVAAESAFLELWRVALAEYGSRDLPLADESWTKGSPELFRFARAKAALAVGLIQTALGQRGYRGWVAGLAQREAPYTAKDLAKTLRDFGRDADALLAGWVVAGAYRAYRWSDLEDPDRDGLPSAYEPLFGTNTQDPDTDKDQLADGAEWWRGLNPAERDSVGDGKPDVARVGLVPDGLSGDWTLRELQPAFRDLEGDGAGELDLTDVWVAADAEYLYLRFDAARPFTRGLTAIWRLYLDFDRDRRADVMVVAEPERGAAWYGRFRRGAPAPERGESDPGLRVWLNRVCEFAIPRRLLEGRGRVAFTLRVDAADGARSLDHLGGYWHPVVLDAVAVR